MHTAIRAIPALLMFLSAILAAGPGRTAELGQVPCWFHDASDNPAWCGKLIVPLRHDAPNGPLITLPVVYLSRSSAEDYREPIVVLSGGPGGPAYIGTEDEIAYWRNWALSLPKGHDVILYDQRGAGLSRPSLRCPELDDPLIWAPAALEPGGQQDILPVYKEALIRCRETLTAAGIDLGAYNSRQSALDLVALRQTLGIERWILFGYSYGTTLALTLLRHDEAAVHAMILDGVSPPESENRANSLPHFDRALSRVFDDCAASEVCLSAYPDLEERFRRLLKDLARKPVEITLKDWTRDQEIFVEIDEAEFLSVLHWALYDRTKVPQVPKVITQMARGEDHSFKLFAVDYYLSIYWADEALGMNYSVNCHEVVPFEDRELLRATAERYPYLASQLDLESDFDACEHWPAGRAEAATREPVSSRVPALLLTGAYDPRTPLPLAEKAAEGLSRSHVFEFPSGAHGITVEAGCAFRLIAAFLAEPQTRPKPRCLSWQVPVTFETGYR